MKTHLPILSFIVLLLLKTYPAAAQDSIVFNLVPAPKGVHPGNKAGVQDQQGYMWIGTYQAPLRRYDGYHYTFYSNDPLDSNSLAQDWVEALCAGRDGTIWIGTADCVLDRLDPSTGNFKHYRNDPKDSNSICNNNVTALLRDREGVIWIGTLGGLNT